MAAAQRAPRLCGYAELAVQRAQFLLLEPGVQFDLVDGRYDFGALQQAVQVGRLEIRDPDGPGLALPVQGLHRAVALGIQPALRAGPVDEIQIHVFQTEAGHGLVEGAQRGVVPLVVVPEFGGDEEVFARERGGGLAGTAARVVAG